MNQFSFPEQRPNVPSVSLIAAESPALELSLQRLALQIEQGLNQLGQRLGEAIGRYLEQEDWTGEALPGVPSDAEQQIWQILGRFLADTLENERVAIVLDSPTGPSDSEPSYTLCYSCGANAPTVGWLATGRSVRLEPGESLSADELLAWKTQAPQSVWLVQNQAQIIGYVLVCPVAAPGAAIGQSDESLPGPLRSRLIDRSIQQTLLALRQLWAHRRHYQALLARTRDLEQTNRLKSEFLANTSHEIRTPLSSILGFTHLIREQGGYSATNPRHQEYLNIILTSGQHLLALINDILDLSKIEANQLDLHWEEIDVASLCKTALTLVREKASDRGLSLKLEIFPSVDRLVGDPLRLKQMLFNLLSNAVKFTVTGTVGLKVSQDEQQMHFCVWDTGTGISAEQRSLLFRPYSQLANVVARPEEGTGLGLALTQKLAELHGGGITVESEIDQGSRFTISLPLAPLSPLPIVPVTEAIQSPSTVPPADPPPAPCAPVLLVEDNHHNAKLMLTFLGKLGYELLWVENGKKMWQALGRRRPALILMDIQLPGVDGLTLIHELRADSRYRSIPVIAQTAMAMTGDRQLCLDAGATDYISKPLDLQQLSQVIAKYTQSAPEPEQGKPHGEIVGPSKIR